MQQYRREFEIHFSSVTAAEEKFVIRLIIEIKQYLDKDALIMVFFLWE